MSDLNVNVKIKSHINSNSTEKLESYRLIARAVLFSRRLFNNVDDKI